MERIGVIAEFNPLHKGHEYLLSQAKERGAVVCVLSGNFVQRGETALLEKRIRARQALECGADLVLELPVLWSMSTAENFALGGVSILKSVGCDKIIFGCESGDINQLKNAADILLSDEFSKYVGEFSENGVTFAKARESAALKCGLKSDILSKPNNNLGIEYIKAAKKLNADIDFQTVRRLGAPHDSSAEDIFVSASLLREKIRLGDTDFCRRYMPEASLNSIKGDNISDIKSIDRAILSVLRTKTLKELKKLPDISEGVENKLFSSIKLATCTEELYNSIKVKRYTLARIRRLCLNAFIGADNSFFMKEPPYIRVLGFNGLGQAVLKKAAKESKVPIVTKVSQIRELGENALRVFETECRATDLFSLSLKKPLSSGLEYTSKIIKSE